MERAPGTPAALDAAAIERVYRARFTHFWKAAMAITGDTGEARDAVQEGFARALAARHTYRGKGSVEAWIWRIVLNAARDTRRRPQALPLEDAFALELPHAEADPRLGDALRQLPKRQRLLIFLHYLADLTYQDMAEVCGISEGAVGASLSKARRTLATLLTDERPVAPAPTEARASDG